jgi:hypothetical protein
MTALTDTAPLLPIARALVIQHKRGSISLVQRHLKIGYYAAAELLEMLEKDGVVGPINGKGGRPVLIARNGTNEFKDPGTDRRADGSQTPNDAAAIPRAKAGSNTTQLEHEARYGREIAQRLDELMRVCREDRHAPSYADLLAVRGEV